MTLRKALADGGSHKGRFSPFTSPQPDGEDEPHGLSAGTGGGGAKAPSLVFTGYITHKRVIVQRQGPPRIHPDCCSQTLQPNR